MRKYVPLIGLLLVSSTLAEELPVLPDGPIAKTEAWRILDQQWKIIEPMLFTREGEKHVGRTVRFHSWPVSLNAPLIVRTPAGTTAQISKMANSDKQLLDSFTTSPSKITVEGRIVKIDTDSKILYFEWASIRPEQ